MMKKKLAALLAAVCLLCCVTVMASAMTLEELQASFAFQVDADGLSAEALMEKGRQYENGEGVVQWYAMAKAYYEAAREAGSAEADDALASLEAFRQSVMDNSPDGQGEIFDFFRTGVTASQQGDFEKTYAVAYDDAFFFGDPLLRGIGSLGDLLRDGTGVERDIEKAVQIYTFNAEVLGKGNGYTGLGLLYQAEDGTYPGIEHSDEKALEYFLLSYQGEGLKETDFKGPRYAADLLDAGYDRNDGTHVDPDYVKAEEGYLIAAKGNGRTFDGTACYKLATYYEEGREGIAQDYAKAVEYYKLAVSDANVHATMLGIPETYLSLGRCYEGGLGIEADVMTAIDYYRKARDAAQENLDLVNAAGNNDHMRGVLEEAQEGLDRLTAQVIAGISLDLNDYADQWVLVEEAPVVEKGALVLDDAGNPVMAPVHPCYKLEGVIYCANPVDFDVQKMDIYVPKEYMTENADGTFSINPDAVIESANADGTTTRYTAQTAPILYQNTIDSYLQGDMLMLGGARKGSGVGTFSDYLESGYVLVCPGTRGTNSVNCDGTAPACIVDLKAGVRFLKANDEVMAGDTNRIIATGTSAGGSATALLGASGNSELYTPYLEAIGAVMDATDDIYCAMVFCPIANLDYGDAAYEWLHAGETTYKSGWGPNAQVVEFSDYDQALADGLVASFGAYLETRGLSLEQLEAAFEATVNACANDYIARSFTTGEEIDTFIAESKCLERAEDGTVRMTSHLDFAKSQFPRAKGIPSFDSGKATENNLFGQVNGAALTPKHFSEPTAKVLAQLAEAYPQAAEAAAQYEADLTQEQLDRVYLMTAANFIGTDEACDNAPYWRLRNGTADGDLGAAQIIVLSELLKAVGNENVDTAYIWGATHSAADYCYADVQYYVNSICGE